MEDAIITAMTLLLVLPMEVLMDHYWKNDLCKEDTRVYRACIGIL